MPQGIYRVRDSHGRGIFIAVRFETGSDLEIHEDYYRLQGYEPAVEQLPWKETDKLDIRTAESKSKSF
jgi:hypothetical protein